MILAEWFAVEERMFEGISVGDMDTGLWYEDMELVSSIGKGTKKLCKIQDGGVMQS